MSVTELCQQLQDELGPLFKCTDMKRDGKVKIQTPFLMPDGDIIDLYWSTDSFGDIVSDWGDTAGWLFVTGKDRWSMKEQRDAVYAAACEMYYVQREDGMMQARVSDGCSAVQAVVKLAQAITAVGFALDVGQQPTFINNDEKENDDEC